MRQPNRFAKPSPLEGMGRTVKARVVDLDLRAKARRRGEVAMLKSALAVPGEYHASRPLEVVQIDHTKVDLIVVDEQTREPLDRP